MAGLFRARFFCLRRGGVHPAAISRFFLVFRGYLEKYEKNAREQVKVD